MNDKIDRKQPQRDTEEGAQTQRSPAEIQKDASNRLSRIEEEFVRGFDVIRDYPRSVTIFGSSRAKPDDPYYEKANSIAQKIAKENFAVVTGGGPGIMEAGNRGAYEHGGESIGLNIELAKEQSVNKYVTESAAFNYFFARKVILAFSAEAYLFFPGGFGTLDEFFEILTLIQTKKIPRVPVILVGNEYWNTMDSFIRETLEKEYQTIDPEDRSIYTITDNEEEVIDIITSAPLRTE